MEPGIYKTLPYSDKRRDEWPGYDKGMNYWAWRIISIRAIIPWIECVKLKSYSRWTIFFYNSWNRNTNRLQKVWTISIPQT